MIRKKLFWYNGYKYEAGGRFEDGNGKGGGGWQKGGTG